MHILVLVPHFSAMYILSVLQIYFSPGRHWRY